MPTGIVPVKWLLPTFKALKQPAGTEPMNPATSTAPARSGMHRVSRHATTQKRNPLVLVWHHVQYGYNERMVPKSLL